MKMKMIQGAVLIGFFFLGWAFGWSGLTSLLDPKAGGFSETELTDDTSTDPLDLSRSALDRRFFSVAVSLLEHERLTNPAAPEVLYLLGQAYEGNRRFDLAIANYENLVGLDTAGTSPFSLEALQQLGELYTRESRLHDSRWAYIRALERETRADRVMKIKNQLAELALTEGTYVDDGNTLFNDLGEVIGRVGPGDMRTNRPFEIGRHTRDWKVKETHFARATGADPGMHQAYFNTGLALVMQSRFSEAVPWFKKSDSVWQTRTDLNPQKKEKSTAHAYLALCYLEAGQVEKAIRHADKSVEIDSSYYYGHFIKARVMIQKGDTRGAIQILNFLMTVEPEDFEILTALHDAYEKVGNQELAQLALSRARFLSAIYGAAGNGKL